MTHRRTRRAIALATAALLGGMVDLAGAAPLDALLDVTDDPRGPTRWTGEMTGDVTQPVFDAAGIDRQAGRTTFARLGLASGPWSFELGGRQRHIQDKTNDYRVQSWQSAVQYEPGGADASAPLRWAIRFSAWGDQSDELVQHTNAVLKVSGLKARLTDMELVQPRDRQLQMDLVGRYTVAATGLAFSGFAGAGSSSVTRSVVGGKATISGCSYQLQFGDARLTARPEDGCPKALIVSVPNKLLAVDVLQETRYRSFYGHAGGAVHWRSSPWQLALGGELQQWQRRGSDTRRMRNAMLAGEVAHALTPSLSVVLRGQYLHRQFLGEVPMLYTASSTSSASRRVLMVSAGIRAQF